MYRHKRRCFISWYLLTWKWRAMCLKPSGFSWNPKYFNLFWGKVVSLKSSGGVWGNLIEQSMEPFTCDWKVLVYTKICSGYPYQALLSILPTERKVEPAWALVHWGRGPDVIMPAVSTKLVCCIQFSEHLLQQSPGSRHCGRQTLPPKCWEYNRRKKKKCTKGRYPLTCV